MSTIRHLAYSDAAAAFGAPSPWPDNINRDVRDLLGAFGVNSTGLTTAFEPAQVLLHTYNAANYTGITKEVQLTNMIAAAKAADSPIGFIPDSMIPFNAAAVTFDSSVHLLREGGKLGLDSYDVLAYGITDDNVTDNYAALTGLIGRARLGAELWFPFYSTGYYKVFQKITNNRSLKFRADSGSPATPGIFGDFNDAVLSINGTPSTNLTTSLEGLLVQQNNTGSAATAVTASNNQNLLIRNCFIQSQHHGLTLLQSNFSNIIENCTFNGGRHAGSGEVGLFVGGHASVMACSIINWDTGLRLGGGAFSEVGGGTRVEVCNTGIEIGTDMTGAAAQVAALSMHGVSTEDNGTALYLRSILASHISATYHLQHPAGNSTANLIGVRIGTAVATTISGVEVGYGASTSVQFDNPASCSWLTLENVQAQNWTLPAGLAGVEFRNCTTGGLTPAFTAQDTTPSVKHMTRGAGRFYQTANVQETVVTNLDDGVIDTPVMLQAGDANTRLVHGANLFLRGRATRHLQKDDVIGLVQLASGRWDEIGTELSPTTSNIPWSATPIFDASMGTTFRLILRGNVTSSSLINAHPGQRLKFVLIQDWTGSRTFAWPGSTWGGMTVSATAGDKNVQDFTVGENGEVEALGSGRSSAYLAASWTLNSISGCIGWYDAAAIGGHVDGDAIGTWTDGSGAGHDLTNGTGSLQPLYKVVGGVARLRFDGTDDYLGSSFTLNNPYTVILVGSLATIASDKRFLTGWGGDSMRLNLQNTNVLSIYNGSAVLNSGRILTAGTVGIVGGVYAAAGNDQIAWVNGGGAKGASGTPGNAGGIALGGSPFFTHYTDCDVLELAVYNRALSEPGLLDATLGMSIKHGVELT